MSLLIPICDQREILICYSGDESCHFLPKTFVKNLCMHFSHPGTISQMAFSPTNSDLFASVSVDHTVVLWSINGKRKIWTMREHKNAVHSLAFCRDGSRIASISNDLFTIIVTQVASGKHQHITCDLLYPIATFPLDNGVFFVVQNETVSSVPLYVLHFSSVQNTNWCEKIGDCEICVCAVSPTQKYIALGDRDGVIRLWDSSENICLCVWIEHTRCIYDLCFSSAKGLFLMSASLDKTAIIWNTKTKQKVQKLRDEKSVHRCALTSDGQIAVTGCNDKFLRIWDTESELIIKRFFLYEPLKTISISPDDTKIVAGLIDGTIYVFERIPGCVVYRIPVLGAISASLSIDQSVLVAGIESKKADDNVIIVNIASKKVIFTAFVNDECILKNVSMHFKNNLIVNKSDTLTQYAFRCFLTARILLFSPGSRFANRMKLSIWDIPDVFSDAVVHLSLGLSFYMAKRMISWALDEENFGLLEKDFFLQGLFLI